MADNGLYRAAYYPFDGHSIIDQLHLFPLPVPENIPPRPLTIEETERVEVLSRLQFFLATAPTRFAQMDMGTSNISKFQLPNGEYVSCVLWNGLYHITGTDIVRALAFRFEAFGRPIKATKKWEEGVFSDLRNLKPGTDACLEDPKSPLLDFLFRNGCIRTQKKQKVFYWFSVPHDRLFLDALERDLKREKAGQEPTTFVQGEPARSFRYDPRRSLYDQFAGQNPGLASGLLQLDHGYSVSGPESGAPFHFVSPAYDSGYRVPGFFALPAEQMPLINNRALFEGSPAFKRRRTRSRNDGSASASEAELTVNRSKKTVRDTTRSVSISRSPSPRRKPRLVGTASSDVRSTSIAPERRSSSMPDDERSFVCSFEFCRRPFKRLEHLKRHVRTHTQEKPFDCPQCARSFSRQDNLAQHLRTHTHPEEERTWISSSNAPSDILRSEDQWGGLESESQYGIPGRSKVIRTEPAHMSSDMSERHSNMRPSTVPPNWPTDLQSPTTSALAPDLLTPLAGAPNRRHRSATPHRLSATVLATPSSHAFGDRDGWALAPQSTTGATLITPGGWSSGTILPWQMSHHHPAR